MDPKKVLLTGGTGFLGSHLCRGLLEAGYDVSVLKRKNSSFDKLEGTSNSVSFYDIEDGLDLIFSKLAHLSFVVHTATNYGHSATSALDVFDFNVKFALDLLKVSANAGVTAFINTDTFFNSEKIEYSHLSTYALSKKTFLDWAKVFSTEKNFRFINLRLEHLYGPYDSPQKFIPSMLRTLLRNDEKLDLTPGLQERDFLYVADAVSAYIKAMASYQTWPNAFAQLELGTGHATTIKRCVEIACNLSNSRTGLDFTALSYRSGEIMRSVADISALTKIGWQPKYDLVAGLKETIAFEKARIAHKH